MKPVEYTNFRHFARLLFVQGEQCWIVASVAVGRVQRFDHEESAAVERGQIRVTCFCQLQ
jgi:hypothetical protein